MEKVPNKIYVFDHRKYKFDVFWYVYKDKENGSVCYTFQKRDGRPELIHIDYFDLYLHINEDQYFSNKRDAERWRKMRILFRIKSIEEQICSLSLEKKSLEEMT